MMTGIGMPTQLGRLEIMMTHVLKKASTDASPRSGWQVRRAGDGGCWVGMFGRQIMVGRAGDGGWGMLGWDVGLGCWVGIGRGWGEAVQNMGSVDEGGG